MRLYNPSKSLNYGEWLALDEEERLDLVEAFHRSHKAFGRSLGSHAAIHAAVETQIALDIPNIRATLERLRKQGLNRHDAIHAIGSVLAQYMHDLLESEQSATEDVNERYYEQLSKFDAEDWLGDT